MLFENDMAAFESMIQYAVLATTSDWDYLYMQSAEQCSVAPQKWPYLLEISAVLRSFGVVHLQSIHVIRMDKSHETNRRDRIFNFSFAQFNFCRPNFCWEKYGRGAQRSSLSKLCGSSVYQVREAETQHQLSLQEIIDDINISPMEDMRIDKDKDAWKTNEELQRTSVSYIFLSAVRSAKLGGTTVLRGLHYGSFRR